MLKEFDIIWEKFYTNNVKYIIIGGLAVNIYGFTRNTGDIDILIEDTLENRKNLRKAFTEIQIGDFPQLETMQFVPGFTDFTIFYGFRLDVMTSVKGLENEPFQKLFEKATIVMLDEIPVYFIDYENLIKSKKAANRLKDRLDLEQLGELDSEN